MKIDRSSFFRPLRDIVNFFVYRSYIKKFDLKTEEGRKWLYQLKRNIELMGYNEGIESFETHYEFETKLGRMTVQNKLKRDVRMQDFEEERRRIDLIEAQAREKQVAKELKIKESKKNSRVAREPFNPEWKPTQEVLAEIKPKHVESKYAGFVKKEYDVPEHGAHVILFEVGGQVEKIFHDSSALKVIYQADKFEKEYLIKHNISVSPTSSSNDSGNTRGRRSEEPEIDISHVNRAMGNDNNNNNSGSNVDLNSINDIDDFLNGLF